MHSARSAAIKLPAAAAPGLYILNYHDVNYESSVLVRGIGYHHSPDVFARHVEMLSHAGVLMSMDEALDRLLVGHPFAAPTFAFWFDDGFAGVRRFAAPILKRYAVTGALSICSRFVSRSEMYWHCMLSGLRFADGLRVLRARLRPHGYLPTTSLKAWLTRHFSPDILSVVHSTYEERVPDWVRRDAFRIFETSDGLRALVQSGWVLANHTAAHYPAFESCGQDRVAEQFAEGAEFVNSLYDGLRFLVVPFGAAHVQTTAPGFYRGLGVPGIVVDVGNRINTADTFKSDQVIYRVNPPWEDGKAPPLGASLDAVF